MNELIVHIKSGLLVDVADGHVVGKRGRRVGSVGRHGYVAVGYNCGYKKTKGEKVHRIVWEAVNGPITDGMQINHINGCKQDNRIANLELVTRQENMDHAYRTGLVSSAGAHNPRAKLSIDAVREIRTRYASGVGPTAIGRAFGVHARTVAKIVKGDRWGSSA